MKVVLIFLLIEGGKGFVQVNQLRKVPFLCLRNFTGLENKLCGEF